MHPSRVTRNAFGFGLVADDDLAPGTVVAVFDGPVVPFDAVPDSEVPYALLLDDGRWLVPATDARYLNHACEPNCAINGELEVETLRDVAAGEELTIAYNVLNLEEAAGGDGRFFWDERWSFRCRCGAATCQGMVDRYVVRLPDDPNSATVSVGHCGARGRGVFARRRIGVGEVIERAPVIVVPGDQWDRVEPTVFFDYTFTWGPEGDDAAIALGNGSLYNHSYTPNARYVRRLADRTLEVVALRDIEPGEEVTFNYNGDPDDRSPLWFAVREDTA
jgi:SET domain-containing protein